MAKPELSIVIPAHNEAGNIGPLINEISLTLADKLCLEVIVVDDGSTDSTAREVLQCAATLPFACRLLQHSVAAGQSLAVYNGMQAARGEWIGTLDGDGQNNPADLWPMLQRARPRTASPLCIIGHRLVRQDSRWKLMQSAIANRVRQWVLRDGTPDTGCGIKILPASTCRQLPYFNHMHRYIPALVKRIGGEVISHPVSHRARHEGVSKYTAWNRGWAGLLDMLGVRWLVYRSQGLVQISETRALTLQNDIKQTTDIHEKSV